MTLEAEKKASASRAADPEAAANASRAARQSAKPAKSTKQARQKSAYLRAENEDDDGYDPYSDRPARPEPLFERDPWS